MYESHLLVAHYTQCRTQFSLRSVLYGAHTYRVPVYVWIYRVAIDVNSIALFYQRIHMKRDYVNKNKIYVYSIKLGNWCACVYV